MSCVKLKVVVHFLKIVVCLLLSRPFGFFFNLTLIFLKRLKQRFSRCLRVVQGTYVLYPQSCRPRSLQTSSFYIVKRLEDLPGDDHIADVRTEWYSQDPVDPLLFTTTGKEHIVSKDGIKGTVNVKWIADDTIEIEENDYYIYLALLHAAKDKVLSFEEPELTAGATQQTQKKQENGSNGR